MSLNELAALIRHVDLNPEDKAATTRLRSRLRASDSSELMKALSLAQKLAESHRLRKVADIRPTAAASARIESASLAVIKYCVVSDAPNQLARLQLRQVMQSHHAFSRASILPPPRPVHRRPGHIERAAAEDFGPSSATGTSTGLDGGPS